MERKKIGAAEFDFTPFEASALAQKLKFPAPRPTPPVIAKTFYMWDCASQAGLPPRRPPAIPVPSSSGVYAPDGITPAALNREVARAQHALRTATGLNDQAISRELATAFGSFSINVPYNRLLDPYKATEKLYLRYQAEMMIVTMTPVTPLHNWTYLIYVPVAITFTNTFIGTCRTDGRPSPGGLRVTATRTFIKGPLGKKMNDERKAWHRAQKKKEMKDLLDLPRTHDEEEPEPNWFDEWFEEEFQDLLDDLEAEEWEFEEFLDEMLDPETDDGGN